MDDLDKYIADTLKCQITEHENYEYTIMTSLKNIKNKKMKNNINQLLKKVAIFIISITTIGGVVFATQISKINRDVAKDLNKNVSNSEYIQKLEMNNKTVDGLTVSIDSITVDDFKIQLNISYLYKDAITSAESNIVIKDENNNLIFENSEYDIVNSYNVFVPKSKNKYGDFTINQNEIHENNASENKSQQVQYATHYKSTYQNIQDNNLKRIIELAPDVDNKFPISKKMYIQFEDIILKNGSNTITKIDKNVNFTIELDKKFMNREISTYKNQDLYESEQDFRVIEAQLSNVQLKVKLEYNGEQDLKELINMSNKIQIYDKMNNQYIDASMIETFNNNIDLRFNINKSTLSNELTIIIKNVCEIKIIKY